MRKLKLIKKNSAKIIARIYFFRTWFQADKNEKLVYRFHVDIVYSMYIADNYDTCLCWFGAVNCFIIMCLQPGKFQQFI